MNLEKPVHRAGLLRLGGGCIGHGCDCRTHPSGSSAWCGHRYRLGVLKLVFFEPRIPPNTGNAIRLVAGTGCELHLIEPLGFDLSEPKLRRAGLDYHDLAMVTVHENLAAAWKAMQPERVFAFTTQGTTRNTDISYRAGDVLLFGPEPTGLPPEVLADPHLTEQVRIPMLPGRRSMNLSNAAAVAVYEAWRQLGFPGAV